MLFTEARLCTGSPSRNPKAPWWAAARGSWLEAAGEQYGSTVMSSDLRTAATYLLKGASGKNAVPYKKAAAQLDIYAGFSASTSVNVAFLDSFFQTPKLYAGMQ